MACGIAAVIYSGPNAIGILSHELFSDLPVQAVAFSLAYVSTFHHDTLLESNIFF